jgi:hypothetical protein
MVDIDYNDIVKQFADGMKPVADACAVELGNIAKNKTINGSWSALMKSGV